MSRLQQAMRSSGEQIRNPVARIGVGCAALLLAVVAATYWKVLGYPFIQDDWRFASLFTFQGVGEGLRQIISLHDRFFYRPMSGLYHAALYSLFGPCPLAYHALALAWLWLGAWLVVQVMNEILHDRLVACGAGILYACAAPVQMDPMTWAVGINELAGTVFVLASFLLFLRNRPVAGGMAYLVAILFKEAAVFLPAVLLVCLVCRGGFGTSVAMFVRRAVASLWMYGVALAVYSTIKLLGRSPLAVSITHPYALSFWGPHIVANFVRYEKWGLETIAPMLAESGLKEFLFRVLLKHLAAAAGFSVLIWSIVLAAIRLSVQERPQRTDASSVPSAYSPTAILIILAGWFCLALLPVIFLRQHCYRYYMIYSVPPLLAGYLLFVRAVADTVLRTPRAASLGVILLVALNVTFSVRFFHRRDAGVLRPLFIEGTNDLIDKAHIVNLVQPQLLRIKPTVPRGSILVFNYLNPWAFDKDIGPRVWYRDPTIEVFSAPNISISGEQLCIEDSFQNLGDAEQGRSLTEKRPLDRSRTFFFSLENGVLKDTTAACLAPAGSRGNNL